MRIIGMIVLLIIVFFGGMTYSTKEPTLAETGYDQSIERNEAKTKEKIIHEKEYYDTKQNSEKSGYLLSIAHFLESIYIQIHRLVSNILFDIADTLIQSNK